MDSRAILSAVGESNQQIRCGLQEGCAMSEDQESDYEWLTEFYASTKLHENVSGVFWHVEAKDNVGGVDVVQFVAFPDRIIAQTVVAVAENQRASLAEMNPENRKRLLCDIKLELLRMDVEFKGVDHPLEEIFIQQFLYPDGLNRNALVRMVLHVQKAALIVALMLDKELDGGTSRTVGEIKEFVN
jgi:hypothetical protein